MANDKTNMIKLWGIKPIKGSDTMKIINKWTIPGTKNKYELHLVEYNQDKTDYEVWSNRNQKHLKDTTSWGTYKGLMRTFGLTFESEKDTVQRKMYLKDIIELCEVNL